MMRSIAEMMGPGVSRQMPACAASAHPAHTTEHAQMRRQFWPQGMLSGATADSSAKPATMLAAWHAFGRNPHTQASWHSTVQRTAAGPVPWPSQGQPPSQNAVLIYSLHDGPEVCMGSLPVRMRGQPSCLASFFTQHRPATRSWRPLIICMGTRAPRIARISFLGSLCMHAGTTWKSAAIKMRPGMSNTYPLRLSTSPDGYSHAHLVVARSKCSRSSKANTVNAARAGSPTGTRALPRKGRTPACDT